MNSVSIRDLHNRTGRIVRGVAKHGRIVVTDRGVPVAELHPYPEGNLAGRWIRRRILPEYAKIMNRPMQDDCTVGISTDRDAR